MTGMSVREIRAMLWMVKQGHVAGDFRDNHDDAVAPRKKRHCETH